MSTRVEKRILVNVPVSTAYNQWTQFEDFPHFMGGVKKVTQLSDDRLEWVAEIAGVKRKWEARILEQKPDQKVAWAATEGATNAGSVEFEDVGGGQTSIKLFIDYEPEGLVEKIGDKLHVVEHQAEADLKRFKEFIEDEGYASGAWRGSVNEGGSVGTPGVEHAAGSLGDSGKAGISGKAAAAAGVAAAAGAAVAAAAGSKDKDADTVYVVDETVTPVVPEYTETTVADTTGTGSALTDETIAHPFDQTNGLIDDEGDSDETAASDTQSAADRAERADRGPGTIPPLGGTSGQH
ncbi:SRPBCC family protein [Arthrobacter sp. QXT-31]|uniref:SRPBCC family protein n=1 Tax=Arthrobacter sp. QXT-31 TaxID=1357915 RepID=UPI000971AB00|nr:SRPBCC family protein [Arthrobacter sp. QXT-31]APX02476.1 cyclase [Arthrobacter sp. QXT-31]